MVNVRELVRSLGEKSRSRRVLLTAANDRLVAPKPQPTTLEGEPATVTRTPANGDDTNIAEIITTDDGRITIMHFGPQIR